MKNKKLRGLGVMLLIVAMSLCACRKDDVSAETTSGYEVAESSGKESLKSASDAVGGNSEEDKEESSVVESSDKSTETIESTEMEETTGATVESTEATKESQEATKESEKESAESIKESVTTSKEQESAKPSKEESKPSASAPSVEQAKPSTPAVHTCDYGSGSVTKDASCKEEGVRTFTCSCGASKTESIAKTGHNYVTDSKAATCDADGYEKTACSTCGDVKSESTTAATGHAMVEKWFPAAPDCTYGGGMHWESCDKCGHRVDLPDGVPLGHTPDAGTVIREADCIGKSLIEHYCIRCGSKMDYSEGPIDPNNHDWAFDNEEQIWYCTGCGTTK